MRNLSQETLESTEKCQQQKEAPDNTVLLEAADICSEESGKEGENMSRIHYPLFCPSRVSLISGFPSILIRVQLGDRTMNYLN
jgi:hypothetical protein